MNIRYEYNIKRALTFTGDDREQYEADMAEYREDKEEYDALTPEDQAETDEPVMPDRDDYYFRDTWDPSIIKLNFDKPKIVHILGMCVNDLISFSNNFEKDNWHSGEWLRAGSVMEGEMNGAVTIRCLKNTPSLYLMLGDGSPISIYAEDVAYNRAL